MLVDAPTDDAPTTDAPTTDAPTDEDHPYLERKIQSFVPLDFQPDAQGQIASERFDQLFKLLNEEAAYHAQHKHILRRALQWQHQGHNTNLLLRGFQLRQANAWFKLAQQEPDYGPIPLAQEFIEASLRYPPLTSVELFICFSLSDLAFARRLNDELQEQGKTTWFQPEDLDPAANSRQEIERAIVHADNLLVVLSPNALRSSLCQQQIAYGIQLGKRMIPLLWETIEPQDPLPETLPSQLAELPWIDFRGTIGRDFQVVFGELIRQLETDQVYVRTHARWSRRAQEWQTSGRSEDLLLRGQTLNLAESWLRQASEHPQYPPITDLQWQLINASITLREQLSQAEEQRRLRELTQARWIAWGSLVAGLAMTTLTFFTVVALRRAEIAHIEAIHFSSQLLFNDGRHLDALLRSLKDAHTFKRSFTQRLWPQTGLAESMAGILQRNLFHTQEQNRIFATNMGLSRNGAYLATQTENHMQIWDLQQHQNRWQWQLPQDGITTFALNQGGTRLATGNGDGSVTLWTLQGEALLTFQVLATPEIYFRQILFHPEREQLLILDSNGVAQLWSWTGQSIATLVPQPQALADSQPTPDSSSVFPVEQMQFSPDGQRLVTLSALDSVHLWTAEGKHLAALEQGDQEAVVLAFSPDGQTLITTGNKGQLRRWDHQGRLLQEVAVYREAYDQDAEELPDELAEYAVTHVIYSPLGDQFATVSGDSQVRLWTPEGEVKQQFRLRWSEVEDLIFTSDGQRLVTIGDETPHIQIWGLEGRRQEVLRGHQDGIKTLMPVPNGHQVLSQSWDGTVRLWNLAGHQSLTFGGHKNPVSLVEFGPQGRQLLTLSGDQMRLWTVEGQLLAEANLSEQIVVEAQFSPDYPDLDSKSLPNSPIAFRTADGELRLGLGQNLMEPLDFQGHPLLGFEFNPTQPMLATYHDRGQVFLWNLQGQLLHQFQTAPDQVNTLSFSPDGKLLITGGHDGQVRFWNHQGQLRHQWSAHDTGIYRLQISPDGRRLVTVAWDDRARLWTRAGELLGELAPVLDVAAIQFDAMEVWLALPALEGIELRRFQEAESILLNDYQGQIKWAEFVNGGQWLLTLSWQGTAQLWDRQGEVLMEIQDHYGQVLTARLSPDRRFLVTGGGDYTAKLWPIQSLDELIDRSCRWLQAYWLAVEETDPEYELCPFP